MNSERITLPRKALPEASDVVDSVQAPVHAADLSSLERARMLVASNFPEDERAHESMNRGTEAAELLGKLGMDAETLAVALLLPLVDKGALDPTTIKKWVGVEASRLTEGALRIASLKDLRKTATETLQANRLRQMLLTIAEDPRVVLVSLAHQLCALRAAKNALEQIRRAAGQDSDLHRRSRPQEHAPRQGVWRWAGHRRPARPPAPTLKKS